LTFEGKSKTKNKISKSKLNEWMWGYIMILPTFIGLMVLNIIPAIQTLVLSFEKSGAFGKSTWVGLDNYIKLFKDPDVIQATINTLKYAILVVPATAIISLIVAVLLNKKMKGVSVYRTIYFLPMVAAPAAIAMVWRWLYNSEYGLINYTLSLIAIIGIWSTVGYNMILLLAGLQEIPRDYYEAANIDGASPIRQFFKITIPLVSPTMFFVVVTSIMSAFQVFDVIFMIVEQGNPALVKTQSLVYLFYKHSFLLNDKGYGAAIIMLLLAIIMAITLIQVKLQKKWVNY
jgi:multiple sugar transport system permease protein